MKIEVSETQRNLIILALDAAIRYWKDDDTTVFGRAQNYSLKYEGAKEAVLRGA